MKMLVMIGGWYFPEHLYRTVIESNIPKGFDVDYYEKMKEKLSSILDKNVQVPKLVQLEFPKLNLPKLEKID